ncbi:MAG TPA: dipeptidase [Armatimonadetes bacterium]|nr:dipeptidase [Armatimonadota bacterium]
MNSYIELCRQAALDILKPGKKELDRGLNLHRESLVFDAYGFAPRGIVDSKKLQDAVASGASREKIRALTEEMEAISNATIPDVGEEFRRAWDASGVSCIFQNAGEEGQDPLKLLKRMARYIYISDKMSGYVKKAANPEEIMSLKADGRRAFYLTCNGVPLAGRWEHVEDELEYIHIFFQLGCRMMHLTYNRQNLLGSGCGECFDGGLSDMGRAAILEMNKTGIIVDVAHSGNRTGLEAAKASQKPMVASHSVCASLNNHCRAKTDDTIRAIAESGGYVGICCIPGFLGGNQDIAAFLDHIDYIAKNFGVDYVAIGTDCGYVSTRNAEERAKAGQIPAGLPGFEGLWPARSLDNTYVEEPHSLAWTNWPLFTVGLVQRGYKDEEIQKIIGGNVLRVARAALLPGGN